MAGGKTPNFFERGVSPSGLADDAQGMEAEWPRPPQAGSVHESPPRRGAPIELNEIESIEMSTSASNLAK